MNDYDSLEVQYSYSGKPDDRVLWAEVAGTEADVRRGCVSLLFTLRDKDERAALWIDGNKLKLTADDIASYESCIEDISTREDALRSMPVAEEEVEEVSEITIDDEIGFEDLEDMPELLKL